MTFDEWSKKERIGIGCLHDARKAWDAALKNAESVDTSTNKPQPEIAFLNCIIGDLKTFSTHFRYKRLIAAINDRIAQLSGVR